MLIGTFAFALMQICVKYVTHIPVHQIILVRSLVSFIISFALIKMLNMPLFGHNKKILFLRGFFGMIALTLFFLTIQKMPLASAVTIGYLSPIFTAVFAIFILKESLRTYQIGFFILSFAGVLVMKGFDDRIETIYFFTGLGSAIFAGLAYNCIRLLKDTDHPYVVVLYFPLVSIPVMGVWSLFIWQAPSLQDWGFLILAGIFTQIGQVYMTRALQAELAGKVTSLKYLGTIYALGFGVFIFGESYSLLNIMGIGLVVLGVILNIWYTRTYVE